MKKKFQKPSDMLPPIYYNAYCTKCGWKGISTKLLQYNVLPDQCTCCHQRGKLRKAKQ